MLTKIIHRIAQQPWVYDRIQYLVGAEQIYHHLAAHVAPLVGVTSSVLDMGGGTGIYRNLWSSTASYICLDIDNLKLQGYLKKQKNGAALCSNAVRVSLKSSCIDVVMCIFVSHHLADHNLEQVLAESRRVLKPKGVFILLDPVWEPRNLMGRLLWRYDVGSHPRTTRQLRSVIAKYYDVTYDDVYSIYHQYFFCMGAKSPNVSLEEI